MEFAPASSTSTQRTSQNSFLQSFVKSKDDTEPIHASPQYLELASQVTHAGKRDLQMSTQTSSSTSVGVAIDSIIDAGAVCANYPQNRVENMVGLTDSKLQIKLMNLSGTIMEPNQSLNHRRLGSTNT